MDGGENEAAKARRKRRHQSPRSPKRDQAPTAVHLESGAERIVVGFIQGRFR